MTITMKQRGVTLFEVLLVLVIFTLLLLLFVNYSQQKSEELRRSRTGWQLQEILNAGLAYYTDKNNWPADLTALQVDGKYLPNTPLLNSWGKNYLVTSRIGVGMLYVKTDVLNAVNAQAIIGKLPLAFMTSSTANPPQPSECEAGKPCFVIASVNIPGQNLNTATAVSFGSIYHNGACVPSPDCTINKNGAVMHPEIIVIPVAVAGMNAPIPAGTQCRLDAQGHYICDGPFVVNALTSYSATAIGDEQGRPVGGRGRLRACYGSEFQVCYSDMTASGSPPIAPTVTGKSYWRVCLFADTDKGPVRPTMQAGNRGNYWGQASGSLFVITRCVYSNEKTGSSFNVWSP